MFGRPGLLTSSPIRSFLKGQSRICSGPCISEDLDSSGEGYKLRKSDNDEISSTSSECDTSDETLSAKESENQ